MIEKISKDKMDTILSDIKIFTDDNGKTMITEYSGKNGNMHIARISIEDGEDNFLVSIGMSNGKSVSYGVTSEEMLAFTLSIAMFLNTEK